MRVVQKNNYFLVALSFVLALFLTIMPLPHMLVWLRPQWMLMVLLFWVIVAPEECGVILAWSVGLVTDLVCGTPIGQQALIFVLLVYIVSKLHPIIAHSLRWQQAIIIGIFAGLAVFVQSIIFGFTGRNPHTLLNILSLFSTILMWPWVFALLNQWRPRVYL